MAMNLPPPDRVVTSDMSVAMGDPNYSPVRGCTSDGRLVLVLSEYQRVNLGEALKAIMQADGTGLQALNSGDWVGELRWALESHMTQSPGKPNRTAEEYKEYARKFQYTGALIIE